jgi:glyoxylase-like metal-dependent hydrolase (beta-lactamase superfamily II)
MLQVKTLVFNPFQENTYLLFDETNECAIVDAGMLTAGENQLLVDTIDQLGVRPVKLLQTHLHLDHVFGARFVLQKYGLSPIAHAADEFLIDETVELASQFGITIAENPPRPLSTLADGDIVTIGHSSLEVIHLPGHSPGGIGFYEPQEGLLIVGDVLFNGSVGRSDLPGGDHNELINGIQTRLMTMPDDVVVYPGHGPVTTIGQERVSNSFL